MKATRIAKRQSMRQQISNFKKMLTEAGPLMRAQAMLNDTYIKGLNDGATMARNEIVNAGAGLSYDVTPNGGLSYDVETPSNLSVGADMGVRDGGSTVTVTDEEFHGIGAEPVAAVQG